MNMLESLLHTCELETYLPNFKKFDIDAFTLKILRDEDLQIIGIEDEAKRKLLLQRAANVQIPFEKFVDNNIDKQYIQLMLNQVSLQIPKISAVLAIALNRDMFVCDVKMSKAAECLRSCVYSLEKQLDEFDKKIIKDRKKKNKAKYLVIPTTIFATGIVLFIYSFKLARYK